MRTNIHEFLYPIPVFVLSTPYDQGRNGENFGGQYGGPGWNEYVRGKFDRDRDIAHAKENEENQNKPSGGPNWGGTPKGSGGGCGVIILIAIAVGIAIAIVVPSAIAALIGSLLLILIVKKFTPSLSDVNFRNAYITSFWTACTYLGSVAAIALLLVWTDPAINGFVESASWFTVAKYFLFLGRFHYVILANLITVHIIAILISAFVFKAKLRGNFKGFKGYIHSAVTTVIIIFPSLIATAYLFLSFAEKFQLPL